MASSFFQIEKLLIDRIKELFPNECEIVTYFNFEPEALKENITGRKPTFYLWYVGYDSGDGVGYERAKIIKQTWAIALIIHHYQYKQTMPYRMQEPDKYVDKLLDGLVGWDFTTQSADCKHGELKLVNAGLSAINTKEVSILPFAFETSYVLERLN
jgi:hypothetical protein